MQGMDGRDARKKEVPLRASLEQIITQLLQKKKIAQYTHPKVERGVPRVNRSRCGVIERDIVQTIHHMLYQIMYYLPHIILPVHQAPWYTWCNGSHMAILRWGEVG